MNSNFAFLKQDFLVLANFGTLAEQYCHADPNSCMMKLGMIGETIVNLMFQHDRIPFPQDNTAVRRIDTLQDEGLLSRDLVDILHVLRRNRNKAVHENWGSVSACEVCLPMAYSLCEWFMMTYGDYSYQPKPYALPAEQQIVPAVDKAKEQEQEQKLVKAAEQTASESTAVPKTQRKDLAQQAASHRLKSEAETRYMIDEQLRQVGWEADTQNLRFSNGTRPEKGRNLAIAEWPTDSTVGNQGRADYALFVGLKLVGIIEAKAEHKDIPSVIDYQCKDYPRNIRAEDTVYQVGTWDECKVPFTFATNGRAHLDAFSDFVKNNVNQIAALNIVCTRPRELTRSALKSLTLALDREGYTKQQLNTTISQLTNEEMTADMISLIRRYAIGSALISHEARIRQAVDKLKKAQSFTKQEQSWLSRMEKYLMEESVLNIQVFDEDSRFKSKGGLSIICTLANEIPVPTRIMR